MKIVLIIGVIIFCVLGFLMFLWLITKKQDKSPMMDLKEKEREEYAFIKQQQKQYNPAENQVQSIEELNIQSRGALYERAIQRKKNNYRDDDIEYQQRLEKKSFQENEVESFQPIEHSLASFIKKENDDKEIQAPDKQQENQEEQEKLKALKEKVINNERKKEMDFEQFKAEILLEAENIKKKRREFLMGSNAVSS